MGYPAIKWTAALETEICDWLAEGKTLREFCRKSGKPSHDAVYDYQKANESFRQRIACARESGEDVIAQECLEIADDAANDWMEEKHGEDEASTWHLNGEHVQRSKLRIETRLKLLAKWNPRKWGEKLDMNVSGELSIADRITKGQKRLESVQRDK